ncbi:MAG: hypothetical protein JOS17DRAFT_729372 [Linnemannia elongata]|nr:MAG: hypothetical protein JOS17DRAFT_729372 [Linnemannia elongata]
MAPAIFGLRFWMAFVTLVNLGIVIAYYSYLTHLINTDPEGDARYEYLWGDYAVIIASVILFPAYLYSIFVKRSLVSNKYARAALMHFPALFMIGVQLREVDLVMQSYNRLHEGVPSEYRLSPFSCSNHGGRVEPSCALVMSYIFVPVVTGFFVIIEVAFTLFRGPLHSPKERRGE